MLTMFASPRKEKVLRGQKRYSPIPSGKKRHTVVRENGNINSKVNLKNCRKTSVDMTPFG